VRPWVEHSAVTVRQAAVAALARVGSAEDVAALVQATANLHDESAVIATRAALRLAPGADGAAIQLLKLRGDLARVAGRHIAADVEVVDDELLFRLLNHEDDEVRLIGVDVAASRRDRRALLDLLDRYLEQDAGTTTSWWLWTGSCTAQGGCGCGAELTPPEVVPSGVRRGCQSRAFCAAGGNRQGAAVEGRRRERRVSQAAAVAVLLGSVSAPRVLARLRGLGAPRDALRSSL
jgi:hypothetical protein